MGIFFRTVQQTPATSAVQKVVAGERVASENKPTIEWNQDQTREVLEQMAQEVVTAVAPAPAQRQFIWFRLLLAVILLAGIGAMIVYTAHDEKLAKFYEILLHAFEVLLGGLIGLLLGESQTK